MQTAKFFLYSGMFLLAFFAAVHYYFYLRLRDIGYKKHIFNFLLVAGPVDYLRNKAKYGWSAWPAYLMWPLLVCGLVLFVIGVFRI
jgi:hypothetical protein